MPFSKGRSGNPAGRPPSEKAFANMLRLAISEANTEGKSKLRAVADRLVDEALGGNVAAMKEIADRLDGKAAQPLEHSGSIQRSITDLSDRELMEIATSSGKAFDAGAE